MVPVFVGDAADCNYCREGVYPHHHDSGLQSKSVARRKAIERKKPDPTLPKRPRGRPRNPETADLFLTCTCHKNVQP